MLSTIKKILLGIPSVTARKALDKLFTPVADRLRSQALSSAGLVIKTGGSALVKTGAAVTYVMADGVLVKIAAATDMPAFAGTVTNAKFNVFVYTVDKAGTITATMGVEAASLALVRFPEIPVNVARLGATIINPTGTGNFVGGTTAIDDATVVPNAAYLNFIGAVDPNIR